MKKKSISAFLLTLVMMFSLSVPAFAAESYVKYADQTISFEPGSSYSETDLFANFKNVMPGDTLTQTVAITNEGLSCDYIKVSMKAVGHDSENIPVNETAAKDTEMDDFLSRLGMKITIANGAGTVIYQTEPKPLEGEGGGNGLIDLAKLAEGVELGTLTRGASTWLNVELTVPIELGNEYADRVGEVDWLFTMEEGYYSEGGGNPPKEPDPPPEVPVTPPEEQEDSPVVELEDEDVPLGNLDLEDEDVPLAMLPQTGDDTQILSYVGLLGLSLLGLLLLAATEVKRLKRKRS